MPEAADRAVGAEDVELVVLARSSRARTGATEGAAVRDTDGRTYAASGVDLPSLQLSALQAAVAAGAAVVEPAGPAAVRDLSAGAPVLRAYGRGEVLEVVWTPAPRGGGLGV